MNSNQAIGIVARKSINQGSTEYRVFKDLSWDRNSSASMRVGGTSTQGSRSPRYDDRDAVTTWELPVADVLDQINWAFTEALHTDDFASTNPSSGELSSERSFDQKISVDDLLAHVDNVFDNPLNLLNPVLARGSEDKIPDSTDRLKQERPPEREALQAERHYTFLKSSSRVSHQFAEKRRSGYSLYKVLKRFARLGTTVEASSHGTITSLGKFILDNETEKAISTILEGGAQSAHVLTEQDDTSLHDHLLPIANHPGVAGYMVLGYDGLIVTSRLPAHMDPDSVSAWALLTYMQAQDFISTIGHKRLRQMITRTETGCVLLCTFGQAMLVVISDNAAAELIVPLILKARKLRAA